MTTVNNVLLLIISSYFPIHSSFSRISLGVENSYCLVTTTGVVTKLIVQFDSL